MYVIKGADLTIDGWIVDGSWMDGEIDMKWEHELAFAFGWVEHGYRMINFLIQSHNKEHAHWRWQAPNPHRPFSISRFSLHRVRLSLALLSLRWPPILQRFACLRCVFWWGRLGFQSLLQASLRVFASPAIIIIIVVVVVSFLLHQFAFSTRLSRLFFYYGLWGGGGGGGGGIALLGFSALQLGLQQPSASVPLFYRLNLFPLRAVVCCVHFGNRLSGGVFFPLSFPVAVEASAWSSLWRFPCLATAWFFLVHGSVIVQLCRKHIHSFCSCFCTTAVTVLVSEGESFLYRGKKDLSGDQNHVECPGYVTRRHD